MLTFVGRKNIGSAAVAMTAQSVIVFLSLLLSACEHNSSPMSVTGTTDHTAKWVEVTDGETQPSSLHISQRVFAPNATTLIEFTLPEDGIVTLTIYDGESIEVVKLLNRVLMDAGIQEVVWDASSLGSGVYVFTLAYQTVSPDGFPNSNVFVMSRKMLLLK